MLSALPVRSKLLLPALLTGALAVVAVVVSVALSRAAMDELERVERVHGPAVSAWQGIQDQLEQVQRRLQVAAGARDLAGLEEADQRWSALLRQVAATSGRELAPPDASALTDDLENWYGTGRDATRRLILGESSELLLQNLRDMASLHRALVDRVADERARAAAAVAGGFEATRSLQARALWAGAGLLLLAVLASAALAWWIAAGVSRPLEALHRAALRIADGDLTVPVEVTTRDEVGALAESFLAMVTRLRGIVGTLRTSSAELAGAAADLERLTRAQSSLLERQAAGVVETSSTTRQLEQSSAGAAQRAAAVLDVARRAAALGERGEESARRSATGIERIRDAVGRIVTQNTQLLEQARAVGEIVETVKDFATQSHVLSLNASIEAIRAGEAGKGFGVVAAEVRGLAEQSGQAATRIGRMVEEILGAIQGTLDLTERSRQGMEGSLDAIRASGQSLTEIGAIVKEASEAAQQFATVVQQQSGGVGQVAAAMRALNAGMDETVARIQGLEEAAVHLLQTSGRISGLVQGLKVE
jgi:methyl-accepting chemotaxis protein